jgi:hypothetical protein
VTHPAPLLDESSWCPLIVCLPATCVPGAGEWATPDSFWESCRKFFRSGRLSWLSQHPALVWEWLSWAIFLWFSAEPLYAIFTCLMRLLCAYWTLVYCILIINIYVK